MICYRNSHKTAKLYLREKVKGENLLVSYLRAQNFKYQAISNTNWIWFGGIFCFNFIEGYYKVRGGHGSTGW